jgi:hypothetical protein
MTGRKNPGTTRSRGCQWPKKSLNFGHAQIIPEDTFQDISQGFAEDIAKEI